MKAAAAEVVSAGATTTLARKKIAENKRQFWRKESIHNCSNSNAAAKEKTPFQLFEYSKLVLWRWPWWSGGSDIIEIGQAVNMSVCVCVYELKTV